MIRTNLENAKMNIALAMTAQNMLVLQQTVNPIPKDRYLKTLSMCWILIMANTVILMSYGLKPNFIYGKI